MTRHGLELLCALSCLCAALLACTGPERSARPDEGRSTDVAPAAPASSERAERADDGDELPRAAAADDEPAPATDEDGDDPACAAARRALESFAEELPAECETDADCMTSHVLVRCRGLTAHSRSAFTPPRLARLSELRQRIRATCPEPRVVCGPAPFDPGACEAGTCRLTRIYD